MDRNFVRKIFPNTFTFQNISVFCCGAEFFSSMLSNFVWRPIRDANCILGDIFFILCSVKIQILGNRMGFNFDSFEM